MASSTYSPAEASESNCGGRGSFSTTVESDVRGRHVSAPNDHVHRRASSSWSLSNSMISDRNSPVLRINMHLRILMKTPNTVSSEELHRTIGTSEHASEAAPVQIAKRSWLVGLTSLIFILLQSACTAVMAVSGLRVAIGLGSLAAAAGLHRPASGFHADAIRIPMMILAVGGSVVNLYVIWRIRTLRGRPSSQWRVQPATLRQKRNEALQIVLALVTLALVAAEYATHLIVHNA